jgi:hypothetical protein
LLPNENLFSMICSVSVQIHKNYGGQKYLFQGSKQSKTTHF